MGKHIAFIGAGAVGGYVGAQLARAGEDVVLIDAWPEHVDAIKRDGMHLEGSQGRHVVRVRAMHIHEVQSLATNATPCFASAKSTAASQRAPRSSWKSSTQWTAQRSRRICGASAGPSSPPIASRTACSAQRAKTIALYISSEAPPIVSACGL